MFDVILNLSGIFNCFKRKTKQNKIDANKLFEFVQEISNNKEKLEFISEFIFNNLNYEIILISVSQNVIVKKNFDNYSAIKYNMISIPIFDRNQKLLGNLVVGNIDSNHELSTDFAPIVHILSKVLINF